MLTESLVRYAQANYDVLSQSFPPALRQSLTLDHIVTGMRGFFYSIGACKHEDVHLRLIISTKSAPNNYPPSTLPFPTSPGASELY